MSPQSISLITTLVGIFFSAITGGLIASRLRLPLLVGYIAGGVAFGNLLPGLINKDFLQIIADTGVTLLLFTLGVEFSFHRLRKILGTVAWAALAQILLCLAIFFIVLLGLGFAALPALYMAIAGALSSTAIVVKIFSEKGELETVPGEVATGWLVVQDLAVVPIMIILPVIAAMSTTVTVAISAVVISLTVSFLKAGVALVVIIFLGRVGIPWLLNKIASIGSREVFLLTTVGIVFTAALATYALGLSAALGAFVAGLLMAETSQNHTVFSEVRPLRDLFAVVFFVSLGLALPIQIFISQWQFLAGFTVLVLFVKWFFVMGLSRFLGYHRKTAFIVGIALTQMSEFGFILAQVGLKSDILTSEQYTLLIALTFMTIMVSAPLLSGSPALYAWFYKIIDRHLPAVFRNKAEATPMASEELPIKNHVVICGYGRVGKYIGRALAMAEIPFLVVDYSHTTVTKLREKNIQVVYGDPADKDVLDYAQVDFAKALVIAIPDRHTQELIIANAVTLNKRIKIICRTHHEEDQKYLKSMGVQTIIQPEFEAALSIVAKLLGDFGVANEDVVGKITRLKIEHGLG